jgi:hypothetical protein
MDCTRLQVQPCCDAPDAPAAAPRTTMGVPAARVVTLPLPLGEPPHAAGVNGILAVYVARSPAYLRHTALLI